VYGSVRRKHVGKEKKTDGIEKLHKNPYLVICKTIRGNIEYKIYSITCSRAEKLMERVKTTSVTALN
jgi:hypothetical protein